MSWIAIKTTSARWEAELMQQLLAAHEIPSRILDMGITCYFGQGSPAVVQVQGLRSLDGFAVVEFPRVRATGGTG